MRNKTGVFYTAYILSLLLFGTNGLYVVRISLAGSQIVLFRNPDRRPCPDGAGPPAGR